MLAISGDLSASQFDDCVNNIHINVHNAAVSQLEPNLVQISRKVSVVNLVHAVLHRVVPEQEVVFLGGDPACRVEGLLHFFEADKARVFA